MTTLHLLDDFLAKGKARLRANTPPSVLESTDMTHFIRDASALLAQHNENTSPNFKPREPETMIPYNQQEKLAQALREFSSLMAPIRRLPAELLGMVFALCTEENQNELTRSKNLSLMLLSQVSFYWRDIALSMPGLWAIFSLNFGDMPKPSKCLGLIKLFLERSQQSPLFLCVWGFPHAGLPYTDHILTLLAESSPRWYSAKLELTIDALGFLKGIRGRLPLLTTLEVQTNWPGVQADMFRIFQVSPQLMSLRCLFFHAWSFPWRQLSNLCVVNTTLDDIPGLLTAASHLQNLRIENVYHFGNDIPFVSTLTLPALEVFGLHSVFGFGAHWEDLDGNSLGHFFDFLTLPRVTHMEFQLPREQIWPAQAFRSLIRRSSCRLRALHLDRGDLQMLQCLAELPELEILQVAFTDSLVRGLTWQPNESAQNLIPKLGFLSLCSQRWPLDGWRSLTPMITSRRARQSGESPAYLSNIDLRLPDLKEADVESIQWCIHTMELHKGLRISAMEGAQGDSSAS